MKRRRVNAAGGRLGLRRRLLLIVAGAGLLTASSISAAPAASKASCPPQGVVRVEITRREPFAGGMSFGRSGSYEKLVGKAYLAEDPTDAHNALIQDIDKVPVDACGHVQFSTDIYILKPVDMSKGNHELFFEVNNRGNKIALNWLNDARSSNDPSTGADAGNGFLMRQGYTVVWAGWEGDVLPGNNRLTIDLPVAHEDGQPITGRVGVQYDVSRHIPVTGTVSLPLSGRPEVDPYPTASLDTSSARLTVRRLIDSPETVVPLRPLGVRALQPRPEHRGDRRRGAGPQEHLLLRRLRSRPALPARLHGQGPQADGARLCGHAARDLLPPPQQRRRGRDAEPARHRHHAHAMPRHLLQRDVRARLPVPGLQRRHRRAKGVRRADGIHRRSAAAAPEHPLHPARHLHAPGPLGGPLADGDLPVQLWDDDRPGHRPQRRDPQAPGHRPARDADRHLDGVLAVPRLAGHPRRARPAARAPAQRP